MKALVVVDPQNDFCPGGALAVAEGDAIIPMINAMMPAFDVVVLTQDWHPAGHSSFASSHSADPFSVTEMPYGPQVLWPDHCIIGSQGNHNHHGKEDKRRPITERWIGQLKPKEDPFRRRDDKAFITAGIVTEIEDGQIPCLGKHQRDDHEGHPRCAQCQHPDTKRRHHPGDAPGQQRGLSGPAKVMHAHPHAVKPCCKTEGMTKLEHAGLAKQDIIPHGKTGQHHDAGKIAMVIFGQHELQQEQERDHPQIQPP